MVAHRRRLWRCRRIIRLTPKPALEFASEIRRRVPAQPIAGVRPHEGINHSFKVRPSQGPGDEAPMEPDTVGSADRWDSAYSLQLHEKRSELVAVGTALVCLRPLVALPSSLGNGRPSQSHRG